MSKPKAYAYVVPDEQLTKQEPVRVEAFDKIRQKKQLKRKKRLKMMRNISLIIVGVTIYLNSPLASVKSIRVTGNNYVTQQYIIDQSTISTESHYFWLNPWEIEQNLESQPLIETAKVKRAMWNSVEIQVMEAEIMGVMQQDEGKVWLLEDGTSVPVQQDISVNVPYFRNWDEEKGKLLFTNLAKIPDDVQRQISEVAFSGNETDAEQIQLYMRDGNVVTISIRQIPEKLVFYFSIVEVLGNQRMHIHLEAGNYAVAL
ncbi:MAG: cell division protein FtsQ/DivIB [Culicoidibacterales bacterium]